MNRTSTITDEDALLQPAGSATPILPAQLPQAMMQTVLDYQTLMLLYDAAIKTVCTKLDIIDAQYRALYRRDPIHGIQSRLKRTSSIARKLQRYNAELTAANVQRYLHDVAGVRVVCSYLDDVYEVAQLLAQQPDVELVRQKDYICAPKRNGYRSLHLILRVPVSYQGGTRLLEVEVQIRTIAMDYWASLEHQLKYKKDLNGADEVIRRLHRCAEQLAHTDVEMLSIRREIEQAKGEPDEADELLERFEKLDFSLR